MDTITQDGVNYTYDILAESGRLFAEARALKAENEKATAADKYAKACELFAQEEKLELFNIASLEYHSCLVDVGPTAEYVDFYNEKLALSKRVFGETSTPAAYWHFNLGSLLTHIGDLPAAQMHTERAVAIYDELGVKSIHAVNCTKALITIYSSQYLLDEAIQVAAKANELVTYFEKNQLTTNEMIWGLKGDIERSLGGVYRNQGKYDQAISNFDTAIIYYKKMDAIGDLAMSHYDAGLVSMIKFNPPKAKEYLEQALYYGTQHYAEDHYFFGRVRQGLGDIEVYGFGNLPVGVEHYETALEIFRVSRGEESGACANVSSRLGEVYRQLGDSEKADEFLRKAYTISRKTVPPGHHYRIEAIIGITSLMDTETALHKLDSAILMLDAELPGCKAQYGDRHPLTTRLYNQLGFVYSCKKDHKKSLDYFHQSLIANSFYFDDKDLSVNPLVDDIIDIHEALLTCSAMLNEIQAMWRQTDNDEVWQNCGLAMSDFASALMQNKVYRKDSEVQLTEIDWFVNKMISEAAIKQNFEFYNASKNSAFADSYFYWLEKSKGQELLFAAKNAEATQSGQVPVTLIQQDDRLVKTIDSLEQVISTAVKNEDNETAEMLRHGKLFEAKRAREKFIGEIEKKYPTYYSTKYDLAPVTLTELVSAVDENTIYVEFVEELENDLYFLAVADKQSHLIKKELIPDYQNKIIQYNKLLRSRNLLRADRRRKFIALSNELYQQFIEPIEHLLEGKEKMVVVGDGVTHYLPFESLLKAGDDKPWHELDFLIRDLDVSYHYSGTLYVRAQSKSEATYDSALLAFAPVFKENEVTMSALRSSGAVMLDTVYRSVDGDHFSPLPHSEKEVNDISRLFQSGATILVHGDASESNLKQALKKQHQFVHIASHSFANIDQPQFSGIACAVSDTSVSTEDGVFYASEIYDLAIQSDVVVLSSCESGVGQLTTGEGLLGLNRSFVYAGVPNVVFSLWKVYDDATADMMALFYQHAISGDSYSSALRKAKLAMLKNPETASPDIWSAFLLVGR